MSRIFFVIGILCLLVTLIIITPTMNQKLAYYQHEQERLQQLERIEGEKKDLSQLDINSLIQAEFSSLEQAIENGNYKQYPFQLDASPINFPQLNLVLDTTTGDGNRCCEVPTYYIYIDHPTGIFWVKYYQASIDNTAIEWYGPIKLVN